MHLDVSSTGSIRLNGCEIRVGSDTPDTMAEHAAIEIQGHGSVHLVDSTVTGDPCLAIDSSGDIWATNTTFNGPRYQRGTGEIHDEGGVTWNDE